MSAIEAKVFAFAALAVFGVAVGGTARSCCGDVDGDACCPALSIKADAVNYDLPEDMKLRIVYEPDRCCPSNESDDCMAYEVHGCTLCQNVCADGEDSCVVCPSDTTDSVTIVPTAPGTDDLWSAFGHSDEKWDDDFDVAMTPGSYDFTSQPEEYDCSACAWENMPHLKQRVLIDRSRDLVCDSTCLNSGGDAKYGTTLCNYFNAGRECRACCHAGHMVEGCMPCEGKGSCDSCVHQIEQLCTNDPCGEKCQAYVCCSTQWSEYSGCVEKMPAAMAELANYISEECHLMFSCETADLMCSDNARTCSASGTTSRHLQEVTHDACGVLSVSGAGGFDKKYSSIGALGNEIVFKAARGKHGAFALQSFAVDACKGWESLPVSDANMEEIVARSTTGRLAFDDGTEPHPHPFNAGAGCARHLWLLYDTLDTKHDVYATVDPSEHPQYITADWVKIPAVGAMARKELQTSCREESSSVQF